MIGVSEGRIWFRVGCNNPVYWDAFQVDKTTKNVGGFSDAIENETSERLLRLYLLIVLYLTMQVL